MGRRAELAGKTFGRLKVIEYFGLSRLGDAVWRCRCSCGKIINVNTGSLTSGNTTKCKSCATKTHGMSHTKLYKVWQGMKTRCTNPNSINFNRYGGRGITYDPRWEFFENFEKDMAEGYRPGLTIERKNNDDGYNKENCIWATPAIQNRNIPQNVYLKYKGKWQIITDWAKELDINRCILYHLKSNYPQWSDTHIIEEASRRS